MNKWMNGGKNAHCAFCSEPDAKFCGEDELLYCDEFCESEATSDIVKRARRLA